MNTEEQRHNDRQGNPSNCSRAEQAPGKIVPRAGTEEPPALWVGGGILS